MNSIESMIIVYEKKTGWGIIKNFSKKVFQKAKKHIDIDECIWYSKSGLLIWLSQLNYGPLFNFILNMRRSCFGGGGVKGTMEVLYI